MNTRPALEPSNSPVALSAVFNQDASCFAIGLDTGFCIYNSEPCQLRVARDFNAGIGAAEMLGKANYIALVGGGKLPKFPQNKLIIWDDAKQKVAVQLPVLTTVRGVKLSRTHIVIALHNSIRVYRFQTQPDLWAAFETADNPLGLCCLTTKTVAFPGRTQGQVQMVDLVHGNVSIIPAHGSPLRAIDISRDGEILATASDKGTLVRVFATSSCAKLTELRRGLDPATIYNIKISPSGDLIAVTSDKSTLHIFDIPHPKKPVGSGGRNPIRTTTTANPTSAEESGQKWGFLSRLPMMPKPFSDIYSFASAKFEMGDEPLPGLNASDGAFKPPKGVCGWVDDEVIIVVGGGRDGRWEKFVISEGGDGKRYISREGWKRYLGAH